LAYRFKNDDKLYRYSAVISLGFGVWATPRKGG